MKFGSCWKYGDVGLRERERVLMSMIQIVLFNYPKFGANESSQVKEICCCIENGKGGWRGGGGL